MAQLLVRKIDESLKEQLRAQAKRKGRSLEEEARAILKGSIEPQATAASAPGWATKSLYRSKGDSLTEEDFAEFEKAIESMRRAPVDLAQDVLVRNLEPPLKQRLEARAREHGRSVEEEARAILQQAVEASDDKSQYGLGSRIAALFADGGFTDEERAALELRGNPVRPAIFE